MVGKVVVCSVMSRSGNSDLKLTDFENNYKNKTTTKKRTPQPVSSSKLYRPSDQRLSVNLLPTLVDKGVLRSQRSGSPVVIISVF
jgi:hypothetical protein